VVVVVVVAAAAAAVAAAAAIFWRLAVVPCVFCRQPRLDLAAGSSLAAAPARVRAFRAPPRLFTNEWTMVESRALGHLVPG